MKKTKIVATMSDFRCTEEFVKNLFDAGMDVVRVNSAHVSEEGATHIVETVHRVNPAIPIMIDTKGPEIRVTTIADEYGNSINFRPGDRVAVRGSDGSDKTTRKVVYMNVPNIVDDIPVGARMLIADGELEIRVVEKTAEELICEFVVGGAMRSRKSVNVPSVSINLPSVTEKDRRFIEWAVKNDVDFIAHSFVRSARDIKAVQDILDAHGSKIKIISKIENREGLDNIDEIIEASYGIMVARGDLGVECPLPLLPALQKRIIRACNAISKPVIVATQMLLSMVNSPAPTRAETTDVANAVLDGADCVMLSEETAMGNFPVETVQYMRKITDEAEKLLVNDRKLEEPAADKGIPEFLAYSACLLAEKAHAKAIVSHSLSGASARQVSCRRPPQDIYALTPDPVTIKALNFVWGVHPVFVADPASDPSHLSRAENFIHNCPDFLPNECAVITAGQLKGSTATPRGTNLVKLYWK